MSEDGEFAVDVLYAIRSGLGCRTLPHAFENDADGDVFSDQADGTGKTELNMRTAVSAYGLGVGDASGLLTPDPTPSKSSVGNERADSCSSAETLGSPSKAGKGNKNREILTPTPTPTKAGTF